MATTMTTYKAASEENDPIPFDSVVEHKTPDSFLSASRDFVWNGAAVSQHQHLLYYFDSELPNANKDAVHLQTCHTADSCSGQGALGRVVACVVAQSDWRSNDNEVTVTVEGTFPTDESVERACDNLLSWASSSGRTVTCVTGKQQPTTRVAEVLGQRMAVTPKQWFTTTCYAIPNTTCHTTARHGSR